MAGHTIHRLEGLEPDNLLAFMALLGLLRALEAARPSWYARVFWTVDEPPLRPALRVPAEADKTAVAEAAAEGLNDLAKCHDFEGLKDLALESGDAARRLRKAAAGAGRPPYAAELWSALVSDAAVTRDGVKAEPTPLCLLFGQGHQHFLERLASVPRQKVPPARGKGRGRTEVSETDCLGEALFAPWERPDGTKSFRWDPNEDVRYALRARNPTDPKAKETTQHGANRLAAIGLSVLTVVPVRRAGSVRLALLGGNRGRSGFSFEWPIWREPITLAGIRALLGHPGLGRPETRAAHGIVECRRARRISAGKYMNFTRTVEW